MCGRYDLSDNPAAIRAKFAVPQVPAFQPNPDLRPTDMAPIVRLARNGERECVALRWGLVPMWAKDLKFGTRCINARAESAATQPAFRSAFQSRRCLVPASAFFEWSGERGRKTKWRVTVSDEPLFAFAGLWERWRDPVAAAHARNNGDGRAAPPGVETFTILTCPPNELLAPVHDRMPVIVAADDYARWLAEPDARLLVPFASERMRIAPS